MRPRSRALILDHLPSKARRAAATALSMSALSPSATSASVSPVEGLGVVNVLPDSASTHLPSIMSWYSRGEFAAGCTDDIFRLPRLYAKFLALLLKRLLELTVHHRRKVNVLHDTILRNHEEGKLTDHTGRSIPLSRSCLSDRCG